MMILDCVQGSAEWHQARLGIVTASAASQIITPAKLQPSKSRDAYMARLLHEWLTGTSAEEFGGSQWTEHGHQYEGEALNALRLIAGVEAHPVGIVYRDDLRMVACSPDWLTNDGEPCEVKCPAGWTHIKWRTAGGVPADHVPQVQFQIWCCGADRGWFVSYAAPRDDVPWKHGASMPPLIVEVAADPRWQDALDEHVTDFVAEIQTAREVLLAEGYTAWSPPDTEAEHSAMLV